MVRVSVILVLAALCLVATARNKPNGSGTKPSGSGNKPNGSGGNKPNGSGGNKPSGSGGNKPSGSGGNKPNGSGGNKPNGSGGNKPSGSGGNKPSGSGNKPNKPGNGNKPNKPGNGNKPNKPGNGNKPNKPGNGNKPNKPGNGNKPNKPGNGNKPVPCDVATNWPCLIKGEVCVEGTKGATCKADNTTTSLPIMPACDPVCADGCNCLLGQCVCDGDLPSITAAWRIIGCAGDVAGQMKKACKKDCMSEDSDLMTCSNCVILQTPCLMPMTMRGN